MTESCTGDHNLFSDSDDRPVSPQSHVKAKMRCDLPASHDLMLEVC